MQKNPAEDTFSRTMFMIIWSVVKTGINGFSRTQQKGILGVPDNIPRYLQRVLFFGAGRSDSPTINTESENEGKKG